MGVPRVLVLRGPGTNCNHETEHAWRLAGAEVEQRHLNRIIEAPEILSEFQILTIPGGFSFGDDLGAGTIFAAKLARGLGDSLRRFRDADRLIIGICNGFQVLLKTGLLIEPDAAGEPRATLAFNRQGRFEDRWVRVRIEPGRCRFLPDAAIWEVPVAHAEGRFTVTEPEVLTRLADSGRLTVRYCDERGAAGDFPINPNGSTGSVAGVCDDTGRVFAMMPHPERHVSPLQHPSWTRRTTQPEHGDGLAFFRRAVSYFD